MEKEKGSASILIDLTDSKIKVYHGTDKSLLYEKNAIKGDWDKIWSSIKNPEEELFKFKSH